MVIVTTKNNTCIFRNTVQKVQLLCPKFCRHLIVICITPNAFIASSGIVPHMAHKKVSARQAALAARSYSLVNASHKSATITRNNMQMCARTCLPNAIDRKRGPNLVPNTFFVSIPFSERISVTSHIVPHLNTSPSKQVILFSTSIIHSHTVAGVSLSMPPDGYWFIIHCGAFEM